MDEGGGQENFGEKVQGRDIVSRVELCPAGNAVGRHQARSNPSQGPRQPAEASPQSALHCVVSSSENPFQPHPGHENSLTRPGSRFGEGVKTS
jgi:hypothetical protein